MLSRYSTPEMATLWSDEARYERWRQVELAVLDARAATDHIDRATIEAAHAASAPTPDAVEAEEVRVVHDVVAFLDAWTKPMDVEVASHVHRELTSSDVVDTAQALAMRDAARLIDDAVRDLVVVAAERALEFRDVLCVGRTHGQPAALTVVGHRFADFAHAVNRVRQRLQASTVMVAVITMSGPVGTGAGLAPDLVADIAHRLNLAVPPVTTQVVFRDGIAAWISDLALLGAVCEAIAIDVRLGQHDGVNELHEERLNSQEGSSAMPHKHNPITAENVTGLARVLRGYVTPTLEDIALWQHRDISHSSTERIVIPDAATLAQTITLRTAKLLSGLRVDHDRIRANIERAGIQLASADRLAQHMASGLRRAEAAANVREELAADDDRGFDLDASAAEVLQSAELARIFGRVKTLLEETSP